MTSDRRAAANRNNAQKSTGPRTAKGRKAVRGNALKHGLSAQVVVTLGEDAEAFRVMADSHLAAFRPRSDVELELVNTFTVAAWVRQRCVSAETCLTNQYIRQKQIEEERVLKERVLSLGEWLFFDFQDLWQFYPDPAAKDWPKSTCKDIPGGPHIPARLVIELESTYPGCCWLLERWNELRILTLPGNRWRAFDKFKAIRLLGKQPLDVLDDISGDLAVIFLATHLLGRVGGASAPVDAGRDARATGEPFDELRCEVADEQFDAVRKHLRNRRIERFGPTDEDGARQLLNNLIAREISRLEKLALKHREGFEAEAAERIWRLAFDPSKEADKVRRYEDAAVRRMSRACADFIKLRESGTLEDDADEDISGNAPPSTSETMKHPLDFAIDGESGDEADETAADAPPPMAETMAAVNLERPGNVESASYEIDAPSDERNSAADVQTSSPLGLRAHFPFDGYGAALKGLLLLLCFWWAMASGRGEALRRESAPQAETQVEPPATTDSEDQQSNPETCATSDTPTAQIKAMAICAGRWGGVGHVMAIASPEDARSSRPRPRNSGRCAGSHSRRSKPRQSVRVARAPPLARS